MQRLIVGWLFLAAMSFSSMSGGAQFQKSAPLSPMQLRVKENICLAPISAGANLQQFASAIMADQKQRLVAVSSQAVLQQVFASIDLDKSGVLSSAEVLGAKGGDDKYCGASCDTLTGRGCPVKCHCHRNEGGLCVHDGR